MIGAYRVGYEITGLRNYGDYEITNIPVKRDQEAEPFQLPDLCFTGYEYTKYEYANPRILRILRIHEYTNFTNPRKLRMHEILRMVWIFEWVWEESAKIMNTPNYIKSRRIGVNR